jgi:uncharacterized membrane protein
MKHVLQFLWTTLLGGLLFLIPFVALAIILGKAFEIAHRFAGPLAELTPTHPLFGLEARILVAICLMVLFCVVAGLFARTTLAQMFIKGLEAAILSRVPGYEYFKSVSESMLGADKHARYPVVLVSVGSAWQFGLRIEKIANGLVAVFIPGAPNPEAGAVYFVTPDRVRLASIPLAAALNCLKHHGVGSNALLHDISTE